MSAAPADPERDAVIEGLRDRLQEAEDVLSAIRDGTVDAVMVTGEGGAEVQAMHGAYRQLAETMSEGVATVAADGTILSCNSCLAALLDRPLEQVLGSALRTYFSPAEWRLVDELLVRAVTAASRAEVSLLTENGPPVPVYASAARMPDDVTTPAFCIVFTNLTDKKHHEQMVADERLAKLILEQAAEAVIVCDDQARIIRLSRAALLLCEGSPIGRPFAEALPLHTDSGSFQLGPVLQRQELKNVDVTLNCDGRAYDLILNAGPLIQQQEILGCVITLTDITERKRAAAASALFRALLDQAGDNIHVVDPETGRFLDVNERACLAVGYSHEEFLKLCVWDIDPMVSLSSWPAFVEDVKQLGSLVVQGVHRHQAGSTFPVEVNIRYVRHDVAYLVATSRDITERKQAEVQLRDSHRRLEVALVQVQKAQRQLVQQENLRALGQMASGLAHDFNNALSPILGFSELLLRDPKLLADSPMAAKYLRIIHTSGTDAANIVRRMREFGRNRDAGDDAAPVDLVALVRQTIDLTRPRWKDQAQAAGKTVVIETDLQPLPMIMGDESCLREMLTNLVFNAVDAMPAGGAIRLSTEEATTGHAILRVSDTGTGMTDEVRQHCLEPFFSTKGEQGTGLGLSMVYGIVRRHSGTVEIDSALGRGTTFTIRFPSPLAVAVPPVDADAPKPQVALRLLTVDDDAMVLDILGVLLREDGHHVETAVDGAAATLKLAAQRFDAVITDMAMPGMSGAQLAATLHVQYPGLPVILLTGFGDLMNAADELPAGVSVVLGKPFTQAGLRNALSQATQSDDVTTR